MIPLKQVLLFILLIALDNNLSHAQGYWDNYDLINTTHGLPHNVVSDIMQDSEGYLWICTYNGLCRYDGNKLKTYGIFGSSQSQNWHHAIQVIFEDSRHNLWVGTKNGQIACFIRSKQVWKTYKNSISYPFIVNCFFEDDKKQIWVAGDAGTLGVAKGDTIHCSNINRQNILGISQSESNTLNVLTSTDILTYNLSTRKVSGCMIDGWISNVNLGTISNKKRQIAVEHGEGCAIYDMRLKKRVLFIPPPPDFRKVLNRKITTSHAGGYYFTDGNIINEYDSAGLLLNSIHISDNAAYDRNEIVNEIMEDNTGILWIATTSGLFKIDKRKYHYRKYSRNNVAGRLTDNYVRCIFADSKNNVWVGFKAGMLNKLSYDNKSGKYILTKSFPLKNAYGTSNNYTINNIKESRNGNIIVGCQGGIHVVNEIQGYVVPLTNLEQKGSPIEIWSLYEDKRGWIWIGTNVNGLTILQPGTGTFYNYPTANAPGYISNNIVWDIYEDYNGTIWIGTNDGLYKTTSGHNDIKSFSFEKLELDRSIIDPIYVWNITGDTHKNLWIGSTTHGIFKVSPDRKIITQERSFPHKVVSALIFDHNNYLWISTVNGLFRYDTYKKTFISFYEQDGLLSNDFNFKAAAITRNGELFLGTKMGMISFHPDSIKQYSPGNIAIHINELFVNGQDRTALLYNKKTINLSYKQNFIQLNFSILDFTKPRSYKYRYILEGFDKLWHYTDAEQSIAVYTNIPPGKYKFIVEGSIDGLQWSKQKAVANFYIIPALWQRPAFWWGCAILLFTAIALIVYRRFNLLVQKERHKTLVEKQIAGLELKALQAQMNPHFIFNSINAIQHFIIHRDEIAANDYLSRFARLMRLFLESSKNKYISLNAELELLQLYLSLEKLRFEDKYDYTITIDENIDPDKVHIPSMLIQPFIENAINHGLANRISKGLLQVSFIRSNLNVQQLKCIIEDNGIGRKKAEEINNEKIKKHISRGTQLIEDRIRTYNFINGKDIDILIIDKHEPETGTRVELTIPAIAPDNIESL